jgi:hypothetical protein
VAVPLTGARTMVWETTNGTGEGAFGVPAWEMRFLAALAMARPFAEALGTSIWMRSWYLLNLVAAVRFR